MTDKGKKRIINIVLIVLFGSVIAGGIIYIAYEVYTWQAISLLIIGIYIAIGGTVWNVKKGNYVYNDRWKLF